MKIEIFTYLLSHQTVPMFLRPHLSCYFNSLSFPLNYHGEVHRIILMLYNVNSIKGVFKNEGDEMMENFNGLGICEDLIEGLKKESITIPTDVQKKVIPKALQSKDLIVQSETGTGKTLAYLLPLFEKLNQDIREMQALILVPTHELAIQVQRQIEKLSQNAERHVTGATIIGNVNITRQIEKLKEKPHIIVGSPGRILELIKKRKITAHTIKTLILDEGDKLLDQNNIETIEAVIKSTLRDRQIMVFSATIPEITLEKAKEVMKEPELVRGEEQASIPKTIEHMYFISEERDKVETLRKLVKIINPSRAIVFVHKAFDIEILTEKLNYHKIASEGIQGGNIKLDRKHVMENFIKGKTKILVASDLATRGLDIPEVSHVFNFNIPEESENYLHRVGRTGRIGNAGVAVSIIAKRELPLVKIHEKKLKIKMHPKEMFEGVIIDAKRRDSQNKTFKVRGKMNKNKSDKK
jgi:superfamily II DNA/RNA helicase